MKCKKEKTMKAGTVIAIACAAVVTCCVYTHRRVIRALITGEEMPKAPEWHFWVPEENRRG